MTWILPHRGDLVRVSSYGSVGVGRPPKTALDDIESNRGEDYAAGLVGHLGIPRRHRAKKGDDVGTTTRATLHLLLGREW